jgi:tRNA-specific 2-thiouridylase
VKFKLFLETALEDGADMIATGHYARVENAASDLSTLKNGFAPGLTGAPAPGQTLAADVLEEQTNQRSSLLKAFDESKDQTYFLYRVTAGALNKTLFPLGEYKKSQVREIAKEKGLVTAAKRDSQGICFVGSVGIKDFLSQFVNASPGPIIEKETGAVIGRHDGAVYYTLGQRHGMGTGGGLPYYVVGKDMAKNEVYVSRNLNDETMWRSEIGLGSLHWINETPRAGEKLDVRLRHRGALKPAVFDGKTLKLSEPERAVAAGQSAVLYRGNEVLGGGVVT